MAAQTDIITQGLDGNNLATQGYGPGSPPPTSGPAPDYALAWAWALAEYRKGETRPVAWHLSAVDGSAVPVPAAASLTRTRPDGTQATQALDLSAISEAVQIMLASEYAFAQAGGYLARLDVTVGQTLISHDLLILVR